MPLEEIKKGIESAASSNAKSIEEKAKQEKQEIISAARKEAETLVKEANENIKREKHRLVQEYEARAEIDARNLVLSAKEEALDAELRRIKTLIAKRMKSSKSYPEIFKHALGYASSEMGSDIVITVSKEDRKFLGKSNAEIVNKEIGGGVIIRSKDGRITLNATIDAMIDQNIGIVKEKVSEALFGTEKKSAVKKTEERKKHAVRKDAPANRLKEKKRKGKR